jgi:hypothetical protein
MSKLARLPDWQSRLSEYILRNARRPFRYGELDCGLWVAGAIEAMTGVDVAAELRGYTCRRQAFDRIAAACGSRSIEKIADHLAAKFGILEISPAFAQRGDAVQLERGAKAKLGVVGMNGLEILIPYREGLLRVPMRLAVRAWHV